METSNIYDDAKIIVCKSTAAENIRSFVQRAALSNLPVLLLGETGVGKEVVAREIHKWSKRREGPFIPINSSCIPENLVESELYGFRKSAFTDAKQDKIGLIEGANGGTFFFDEISEIPLRIQTKLLRMIERKEIMRLGDNRTRKIDVRFIFAINKDLREEVEEGRFREDLYYRICILELYIPPLRERKEDIPLLVENILKEENKQNNGNKRISKESLAKLMEYHYPGNIRELENIIKRAYVFSDGDEISAEDIRLTQETTKNGIRKKSRFSKEKIIDSLVKHQGNKTKAAKQLGMSRRHIYRLLNFKK
ncbi:MAG: sigma-54 dependent transcriptional regulator [Acidobacteriota bacterium]|nr:sigma-54 dependent transcriptional regulator [Acidobacteriota bacterium]